jgi:hypothetical protein
MAARAMKKGQLFRFSWPLRLRGWLVGALLDIYHSCARV